MTKTVWLAVVEHGEGVDITVCSSIGVANSALDGWAHECWEQEFPDEPAPPLDTIQEVYFEKMRDCGKGEYESIDGPLVVHEEAWRPTGGNNDNGDNE